MSYTETVKLQADRLPDEVFESVVKSLHGDTSALLIGKLCTWFAVGVVCYKTGNPIFIWALGFLIVVGLLRTLSIRSFLKLPKEKLTQKELKKRETIYGFWATLYVGLMGAICTLSMALSQDQTVHLMLICTTLAYILGIAGRNFGSAKVVNAQVIAVSIPLILGLGLFGNGYHKILAALLIPFLLALHIISYKLRQMLFTAVFTSMENESIANRFEIAMKNASHGMAMMDKNGDFMIANQKFNNLFGTSPGVKLTGLNISEIGKLEMSGRSNATGRTSLSDRLKDCIVNGQRQRFMYTRIDGVTIEATFNPMTEGAGVLVLEDVSERINSENEIRQLANFDSLTHLSNKRHFNAQLDEQCKNNPAFENYATFFLDLDKFKDINDSLGHAVGDKLLCVVSLRMKSCVPDDAIICRFGGDEFIIAIPNIHNREQCKEFAQKIIDEVCKPILIDGNLIIVGTSIGIALCPEDSNNFQTLFKMADVSLYQSKAEGRGIYCFYNEKLGEKIKQRRQMELDLRSALENNEFEVYYQPLIDLETNRIGGCEALMRWVHPTKGFISPAEFIPVAEEIGLISKIGKFVLETAAQECMNWPAHIRVAVNVSSLQFKQSDVCSVVTKTLLKTGLNPSRLEIEVTESSLIEDLQETSRVLRSLAQGGVRISLDDFGTGFSSLSYLHQLPLDKVKIDRSFVEDIQNDERSLILLTGVTEMAKNLGLTVIVEGVEKAAQMELLREKVHMDQVQGYLFGKAMPADQIYQTIQESHAGQMPSKQEKFAG